MNEVEVHLYDTEDREDDGASTEATDAQLADSKMGIFTADGPRSRNSQEIIQHLGRVINGEGTSIVLPGADYKLYIGVDNQEGKLKVLKEHATQTTVHTGTFVEFTNAQFLGVHITDPTPNVENDFYYNRLTGTFRAYITHNHRFEWRNTTPDVLHSGTVVWLGSRGSDNAALHHISNFNSSNHYYYYNRNAREVRRLQNGTYVEGTEVSYQYEWVDVGRTIEELIEIILAHETYPWSHSIRIRYIETFGTGGIEFHFETISDVDYLVFSSNIDDTVSEDWLKTWEKHDEFAIVTDDDKDEVFHAEIDGDYDEANYRIPVIGLPDDLGLTDDTIYRIEATRAGPDVGQELPRIREEVLEGIDPFAHAKRIDTARDNEGEYVDVSEDNVQPMPRDRRYGNIPLPWRSEYLNAWHYDDIAADPTDADDWDADNNTLVFTIVDVLNGTIAQSPFSPLMGSAVGNWLGVKANDAAAEADSDYNSAQNASYFNSTTLRFRLWNTGSWSNATTESTFHAGTWIPPSDADTQAEVLAFIEAETNPNTDSNYYAYYNTADNALHHVTYTFGTEQRFIRLNSGSAADATNIEAMAKHDVVYIEGTEGNDDGVELAMFVAVADWDDTDGLEVDTLFYRSGNTHFDYDSNDQPLNVYLTRIAPEIPDDSGDEQQSFNVDVVRSLVRQFNDTREWLDILANPACDLIYKAGSSDTDFTQNVNSSGDYSLKSGFDFRDYGFIAILHGENNEWTRASMSLHSRKLLDDLTRGTNAFGEQSDNPGVGRINIYGQGAGDRIRLRIISDNQFQINYITGMDVRAIWGIRQGDTYHD